MRNRELENLHHVPVSPSSGMNAKFPFRLEPRTVFLFAHSAGCFDIAETSLNRFDHAGADNENRIHWSGRNGRPDDRTIVGGLSG